MIPTTQDRSAARAVCMDASRSESIVLTQSRIWFQFGMLWDAILAIIPRPLHAS